MIRRYAQSDADAVVGIWEAASRIATPFLSDGFIEREREIIRTVWMMKAETWVFEVNGVAAGFLSLIGNEVGAIFVHPDFQRRGIGRTLMNHAASLRDELFLDVFAANAVGRRFYDSYGFRFDYEHVHDETGQMMMRLSYTA